MPPSSAPRAWTCETKSSADDADLPGDAYGSSPGRTGGLCVQSGWLRAASKTGPGTDRAVAGSHPHHGRRRAAAVGTVDGGAAGNPRPWACSGPARGFGFSSIRPAARARLAVRAQGAAGGNEAPACALGGQPVEPGAAAGSHRARATAARRLVLRCAASRAGTTCHLPNTPGM